jgi:hypothetical protein
MNTKTKTAQALSDAFKSAVAKYTEGTQATINSTQVCADAIVAMRKTRVKFGSSRATCAFLQYTYDTLATLKTAQGKPLAAGTLNNHLRTIKQCVNDAKPYIGLNPDRTKKPKPAGQSQTPKSKDASKLVDDTETDIMASNDDKPAMPKVGAYKSNDDAIAALVASIKTVKTQCTIAQWKAITTLYPSITKMID